MFIARGGERLLAKVLPDLRQTVGDECAELVERGAKIELEAIMHTENVAESLAALVREQQPG